MTHPSIWFGTSACLRARRQATESAERNATYSSMVEVPGNLIDVNAVEEERYLAAALFGLAGSPGGRGVILKHPAAIRGVFSSSLL